MKRRRLDPIRPSSFYGSKPTDDGHGSWDNLLSIEDRMRQAWLQKLEGYRQRAKEITALPLAPLASTASILSLGAVWRVFYRQEDAFQFAAACYSTVHTFAVEFERDGATNGSRRYIVSSYTEFWRRYMLLPPEERNHYEVIPEFSPCHLYLDIEYKVAYNPECKGPRMMHTLLSLLSDQFKQDFQLDCPSDYILDLDSSTAHKFSRHLIVRLPGIAFRNNRHAGTFMRRIEARCRDSDDVLLQELLVRSVADGPLNSFVVDMGVYTRNRNFRLYLSTKRGRNAYLTLAEGCEAELGRDISEPIRQRAIFLRSLVCNVPHEARLLSAHETSSSSQPDFAHRKGGTDADVGPPVGGPEPRSGYIASPFPRIDKFILSLAQQGGVAGGIRRWAYFEEGKVITYDISRNRYCANIGRAHKSNGVMYIAHLTQGICYQKCHDPDCRRLNFRSQAIQIPPELNPLVLHDEADNDDPELEELLMDNGVLMSIDMVCDLAREGLLDG